MTRWRTHGSASTEWIVIEHTFGGSCEIKDTLMDRFVLYPPHSRNIILSCLYRRVDPDAHSSYSNTHTAYDHDHSVGTDQFAYTLGADKHAHTTIGYPHDDSTDANTHPGIDA